MGKPRFSRKKYETPNHPWQADRIKAENELVKKYGLKNKKEIWKAQTYLKKYRGQARSLLAKITSTDPQVKKEVDQLVTKLTRLNMLPLNSNLDDVLALDSEAILSRRLQTLTYLKGLAHTPKQARQLISHGHIAISGRRTTIPSYIVAKNEENEIGYVTSSPLNDVMHPARPKSDFPSPAAKKIEPAEKQQEKQLKTDDVEKAKHESLQKEKPKVEEHHKTEDKTKVIDEKQKQQMKTPEVQEKVEKKEMVKPQNEQAKHIDEKLKQQVKKPEIEKKEMVKPQNEQAKHKDEMQKQQAKKPEVQEKADKKEVKPTEDKGGK